MSQSPNPNPRGGDFSRLDETDDAIFYAAPRMVSHLDAQALTNLERIVDDLLEGPPPRVLDLMASWDSHLPADLDTASVVGLGLNQAELEANPRLTSRLVRDLNRDPRLPFAPASFDAVLIIPVRGLPHQPGDGAGRGSAGADPGGALAGQLLQPLVRAQGHAPVARLQRGRAGHPGGVLAAPEGSVRRGCTSARVNPARLTTNTRPTVCPATRSGRCTPSAWAASRGGRRVGCGPWPKRWGRSRRSWPGA